MLNTMKMLDAIFLTWVVKSAHLQLTHFRNLKLYHNIFMYRLAKLPVDVLAQLTVMLGMITISTTSLPTAAPASPPPKSSTLSRSSPPRSTASSPATTTAHQPHHRLFIPLLRRPRSWTGCLTCSSSKTTGDWQRPAGSWTRWVWRVLPRLQPGTA